MRCIFWWEWAPPLYTINKIKKICTGWFFKIFLIVYLRIPSRASPPAGHSLRFDYASLIKSSHCRTCGSHPTHPNTTTKNRPFGRFLFWWGWVDSNHLSHKTTDLQSAPALQLRRTPNLLEEQKKKSLVLHLILGASSGNRTRISSLEGLHTSLCTMPATNSKPCDYILNQIKIKH